MRGLKCGRFYGQYGMKEEVLRNVEVNGNVLTVNLLGIVIWSTDSTKPSMCSI